MLTVRDRQLAAIARANLPAWLARHLKKFFPERCKQLGEEGLRSEIRYGMERAWSHGFRSDAHTARYLDLMFALGRDFDKDAALGWPAAILSDPAAQDPESSMSRLLAAARDHLETAAAGVSGGGA